MNELIVVIGMLLAVGCVAMIIFIFTVGCLVAMIGEIKERNWSGALAYGIAFCGLLGILLFCIGMTLR